MQFSPEQFASLRKVMSEPSAKAAALASLPTHLVASFLSKVELIAKDYAPAFVGRSLVLFHVRGESGGTAFDDSLIRGLISAKTEIVAVGDDATFLTANTGEATLVGAAHESEQGGVCVLCSAGKLVIFSCGMLVAEVGSSVPVYPTGVNWQRSWREAKASFDLHFQECIENEKGFTYWGNKGDRCLISGPAGTEELFHHSLFWWCKRFISDAIDVYGETKGMGQDKTDITIVTEVGNIVIEVKWLGKNESNTTYSQIRINEGLIQVHEYLQKDPKLMRGYLVMYDARTEHDHINNSSYPPQSKHVKCNEPILYFLRSETPSQRGVRLAKKAKS